MKRYMILFGSVLTCLVALVLTGMDGCNTEDLVEVEPVSLLQAIPATGSEIQQEATIVASFDGAPTGVQVTGAKFSVSGANVTITGPFTAGALQLTITWSDGSASLTYKVKAPVITRYDGESIYFKIGNTIYEGSVVEGVSADEVLVELADGGEKVINVDRIGGTLIADHPDIGVRVKLLGDRDKGESILTGDIAASYSDDMRKIDIFRVKFIDGRLEHPDGLIRFVSEHTEFEDGGFLTLDEFMDWLDMNN